MARGGRKTKTDEPERRCIVTGDRNPKRGLIRFVVGPDQTIVADHIGKLPGRGLWVTAERDVLVEVGEKNHFSRAARQSVTVPDDYLAVLEAGLAKRVVELLSLARKAGLAVAGFEKVKDWLAKDEARILLQASDGSERGKSKLRPPGGTGSFFGILTASELGLAFGREHVIHAALAAGGLTETFRDDAVRLSGVRENDGGLAAGKVKKTI